MKKIIISTLTALTISSSLYAFSVGEDTGSGSSSGANTSRNAEQSLDSKNSKSNSTSQSDSRQKEISYNTLNTYVSIIKEKEEKNESIFGKCRIYTAPKSLQDFSLSSIVVDNEIIDSNKQPLLSNLKNTSTKVSSITSKQNIEEIKDYTYCVTYYAAVLASSLKKGKFTTDVKKYKKYLDKIEDIKDFRLDENNALISNNGYTLHITSNPNLTLGNIQIHTTNQIFGYSSSERFTNSTSKDYRKETNVGSGSSIRSSVSLTNSSDTNSKSSTSMSSDKTNIK